MYDSSCSENDKLPFKEMLLKYIMNLWIDKKELTKQEMLDEIINLKHKSEALFSPIFHECKFRIGVSQKLICLYAKYLWVSGQLISPPPLIPYDGVVKKMLKDNTLTDWTVLDNFELYENIIQKIDIVSNGNPAEWELIEWNKSVFLKNTL